MYLVVRRWCIFGSMLFNIVICVRTSNVVHCDLCSYFQCCIFGSMLFTGAAFAAFAGPPRVSGLLKKHKGSRGVLTI